MTMKTVVPPAPVVVPGGNPGRGGGPGGRNRLKRGLLVLGALAGARTRPTFRQGNRRLLAFATISLLSAVVPSYGQDDLSPTDRRWMEEVAPLMTAAERQKFRALEEADRDLFKELFWARRDPTPANRHNEAKADFEQWREQATEQTSEGVQTGAGTDIALVTLLLGPPDTRDHAAESGDRQPATDGSPVGATQNSPFPAERAPGSGGSGNFGDPGTAGLRMTWDPDPEAGIPDGLEVTFRTTDFGLWMVRNGRVDAALERARWRHVAWPSIDYALTDDGRLGGLEDRFDPNSPAKRILNGLREGGDTSDAIGLIPTFWFFRGDNDDTYAVVLIEVGGDETIQWDTLRGGYYSPRVQVFYSVEDALGTVVRHDEGEHELHRAHPFLELPIQMPPGHYTVRLGIRNPATDVFGTTTLQVDVPDFSRDTLSLSSLARFSHATRNNDLSPVMGRAFFLGDAHFEPRFSPVYGPSGQFRIVFAAYGYAIADNGQPNLNWQITFTRYGEPYVRYEPVPLVPASTELAIGIVDLFLVDPQDSWRRSFENGAYCAEITVNDLLSGQSVAATMPFSVEIPNHHAPLTPHEALGGCDR